MADDDSRFPNVFAQPTQTNERIISLMSAVLQRRLSHGSRQRKATVDHFKYSRVITTSFIPTDKTCHLHEMNDGTVEGPQQQQKLLLWIIMANDEYSSPDGNSNIENKESTFSIAVTESIQYLQNHLSDRNKTKNPSFCVETVKINDLKARLQKTLSLSNVILLLKNYRGDNLQFSEQMKRSTTDCAALCGIICVVQDPSSQLTTSRSYNFLDNLPVLVILNPNLGKEEFSCRHLLHMSYMRYPNVVLVDLSNLQVDQIHRSELSVFLTRTIFKYMVAVSLIHRNVPNWDQILIRSKV